jgi:tetratricopeptide (TPR) repeat protein
VNKVFTYTLVIFLLTFDQVSVNGQELSPIFKNSVTGNDQDYYYAFTEATRYFMTGNYMQAVNLYNECLRMRSSSGAPHYQLSRLFLNAGNKYLALEHAKKAVSLDETNKFYLQGLANIYQVDDKKDSAVLILKRLMLVDVNNPSYLLNIAGLYEELGKMDSSLKYLNLIDKKVGKSKEVSLNKYRIFEKMSMKGKAIENLKFAYTLEPTDYRVAGMLAEFYRSIGEKDSAYKYYREIYPAYKEEPMVSYSYSEFLLELGDTNTGRDVLLETMREKSINILQKSEYFLKLVQDTYLYQLNKPVLDTVVTTFLSEYPNDIRALSVYSDIQIRRRNFEKASAVLVRVYALDKRNYLALEQLLYSLNIQGKTDSVFFYSEEGVRNFSDRPLILLFNGSAKNDLKMFYDALIVLNKGLSIVSDSSMKIQFYNLIADSYRNIQEFDKSDDAFEKALMIDPDNLLIKNNYAYYLAVRGERLKIAKSMSKQTIKNEPQNSTYLDTYAWILFKMNNLSGAKKYILRAISYNGDKNSEILLHAGEIFLKAGIFDKALIFYKMAIGMLQGAEKVETERKINELISK